MVFLAYRPQLSSPSNAYLKVKCEIHYTDVAKLKNIRQERSGSFEQAKLRIGGEVGVNKLIARAQVSTCTFH